MPVVLALFFILLFASRSVSIPARFDTIVRSESRLQSVPLRLVAAIISVESSWDENARGQAGEIGLMQLIPATAEWMGFTGATEQLFDPETNIHFGVRYLRYQLDRFDNRRDQAIAAYNAGTPKTRIDGKFTNQEYVDRVNARL